MLNYNFSRSQFAVAIPYQFNVCDLNYLKKSVRGGGSVSSGFPGCLEGQVVRDKN